MLKIYLIALCFSIFVAGHSAYGQTAPANSKNDAATKLEAETKKVKEKIAKIGIGNDITIYMRNGKEFYGTVHAVDDNFVRISEVDLNVMLEARYDEIKSVAKGYGFGKTIDGRRIPPKKSLIRGAIIVGAIIGIGVLVASQAR